MGKTPTPQLDVTLADQILQNVFADSQTPPSSIPLEVLISYSNYRKERFAFQKLVLIFIILLFCLLPFLFIYPDFEIVLDGNGGSYPPTYTFSLDTDFPIKSVVATLNDTPLSVTQTGTQSFSLEPSKNGVLLVSVTLWNNQTNTEIIEVDTLDTTAPVFLSSKKENQQILLYVNDAYSGIDYKNITAVDSNGKPASVSRYNELEGVVVFDYPQTSLDIYIPDFAGNTLHLVLNAH